MNKQNPSIEVTGVYKPSFTEDIVEEAVSLKYGTSANQINIQDTRAELNSVRLIELLVQNSDKKFTLDSLSQMDSEQAAYDEEYYAPDYSIAYGKTVPPTHVFKVLLWFHFLDESKPLQTCYGVIELPQTKSMPEILKRMKRYEPVD